MSAVEALRRRLALQHEAIWLLGLVGGRFPELRDAARAALRVHGRVRDRLAAALAATDGAVPAPQLAYGVPPTTADDARARLADVERRIAAACVAHVGVVGPVEDREEPVTALRRAALAALDWDGAAPEAFPGLTV